jgi:hypothetical protein
VDAPKALRQIEADERIPGLTKAVMRQDGRTIAIVDSHG